MGVISQLKLLCWKNYVTKKRNKVRLGIEVMLPIILFLVLMFLRRIGDKKILPDCYFKPKAMPSAGDLAFYQSFYCSLNNTCDDSTANASLSIYNASVVSTIMHAIEEAFDLAEPDKNLTEDFELPEQRNRTEQFQKYFEILRSAVGADRELAESNVGAILSTLALPADNRRRKFTCGLQFPRRRTREATWKEEPGGTDTPAPFVNETNEDDSGPSPLEPDLELRDFADSPVLKGLDFIFCGPNVPAFAKQLQSLAGQTDSSWERKKDELESQSMSTSSTDMEFEEPEYENDTSLFCNNLMRNLEKSLDTRFVWKIFKPFIRGKIVYTPDAPVINKLMGRINDTFARPQKILEEFMKIEGFSGLRELNLIRNNEPFLRTIVSTELGGDLLRFFRVKADGDAENKKAVDQDVKALRKIIDNVVDVYNRQTQNENPAFRLSDMRKYIDCIDWSRTVPISTAAAAEEEALKWLKTERLWAMVEFMDVPLNATELPTSITYKIRTGIERTHATFQLRDRIYRPRVRRDPFIDLKHITGGWAYVQNLVEGELIRELTGRDDVPGIYLQQTPYPCHIKDMFRESITRTLPMFMIVSWIFLFSMLIKKIVWEKEKRVTQTLRVMGVGKAPHWIAWFLDAFIPMFFVSFVLAIILVYGMIIPFSSFFVVWVFLVTFILPTITLAFLVSTCFSRASIAAAVSGLLFLLIYLPYPPISQFEERLDPRFKVLLCLVSNIAFGLGCSWLANMEELGIGGHVGNMHVSPVPGNPINMNLILGMLLLDAVIYLLLALYIENVWPGGDGVGRPFYYPLTIEYWFGVSRADNAEIDSPRSTGSDQGKFEAEPEGLVAGVSVENLTKRFGRKLALNELSINFYEDQITSFLGHNGAGKSTAISIMTGLAAPTSGSVRLYGRNLNADCEIRNRDLGICSQENVLLEDLTVEEHLYFYARIKGASEKQANEDAYTMMKDVGILVKRNTQTKHLSGGTQRKVCVAIAFIGGSKVVFLDEPTAGVDPASRRAIWDLLIKYKKGRTVVLTTHFMDEADLLGDRIAIIAKGRVVCCGSPVFLKAQLGSGYYLTMDCDARSDNVGRAMRGPLREESAIVKELNKTIQGVVPDIKFLEQIGSEITFVIPLQSNIDVYDRLFAALENERQNNRINSYGISDTSLEEIFLKIAEESETDSDNGDPEESICSCFKWKHTPAYDTVATVDTHANGTATNVTMNHTNPLDEQPVKLSAWQRNTRQFTALIIKRAIHHSRNYTALIVEIVLPAAFIALSLYLSSLLPSIRKMPPLEVDVSAYAPSYMFYSLDIPQSPRLKSYEQELLGSVGIGTKCVRNPGQCSNKEISKGSLEAPIGDEDTTPCPCNSGRYSCSAPPHSPPYDVMSSGDRLYNLTGQNITNWIIKTELSDSYIRYGGLTFGYRRAFNSIGLTGLLKLFKLKELLPFIGALGRRSGEELEQVDARDMGVVSAEQIATVLMLACTKSTGDQLLKGADINDNIIIWYNNRGWISGIAYMNAVSNLVLRASLPAGKDRSKYSIRLINHPLPITARQFEDEIEKQSNVSLLRALAVIWALAFIPATYAVYLIGERASGFKHLQLISGVGRIVYWTSSFLWDFLCFAVTIFVVTIIFLFYQEKAFVGEDSIAAFLLLLFSYAAVSISCVYPISFVFDIPSTGFVAVSTINIFVGMVTLLTTFVMSLVRADENPFYLNTIFMIFPQFCLGKALLNMSVQSIRVRTLATLGVTSHPSYLNWEISLQFVTVMLVTAGVFFVLTLVIEFRGVIRSRKEEQVTEEYVDEDEDVKRERERVGSRRAKAEGDVLLLDNLSKWYKGEPSAAVDRLCLGVKSGECFGLLGLNGAGKTTVFKMLTGSLRPSSGDASIMGESIREDGQDLPLGYCPQSNALDPYLTPAEHLAFFARLRGLTGEALHHSVAKNIERLGLEIHRNKLSSALSGGNKRKVNTALALVGEPRLVLLDEPTSGMDPRARRFLWQCVQTCVQEGRCVILTSHSMEECQSLCSRLSILVNGRFRCLGTCQQLKNKFDEGYSVTVRCLSIKSVPEVQSQLAEKLPKLGKFEVNYLQIKFRLSPGASLGQVFTVLDNAKREGLIRDYSISQTTLEQIFIKFAESQNQPTGGNEGVTAISKFFSCCCPPEPRMSVSVLEAPAEATIQAIDEESEAPAVTPRPAPDATAQRQLVKVTIIENPHQM